MITTPLVTKTNTINLLVYKCTYKMSCSQSQVDNHESVQELAKQVDLTVPQRYVQENREPTAVSNGAFSLPTIPIVDMNHFIMAGSDFDFRLNHLRSICQEWGIFQLVNHGVEETLIEKMKAEVEEFFKISAEEKERYRVRGGEVEGYGQTKLHSQHQKVDWADRFYIITNPLHRRKPHLMPHLPPSLRDTMEKYLQQVQKLGITLFELIGKALNIEMEEMIETFDNGMQSVRMTYYPPCPQPDLVIGITPHSDASGITILLQVNQVEGLQVKKDGVWIPVTFLPNALVVNIGDILEIMSNGICNSIEHRATVNKTKERISLAMFFNPKFEADVGPAKSLLTNTTNAPLYKTLVMEEYFKEFFSHKLNGKTFLNKLKINNQNGHDN